MVFWTHALEALCRNLKLFIPPVPNEASGDADGEPRRRGCVAMQGHYPLGSLSELYTSVPPKSIPEALAGSGRYQPLRGYTLLVRQH